MKRAKTKIRLLKKNWASLNKYKNGSSKKENKHYCKLLASESTNQIRLQGRNRIDLKKCKNTSIKYGNMKYCKLKLGEL